MIHKMSKDLTHLCLPPTVLVVSEFVLDRIHWYQKLLTQKSDLHFPNSTGMSWGQLLTSSTSTALRSSASDSGNSLAVTESARAW